MSEITDNKLFISKLNDAVRLERLKNFPRFLGFLTEEQQDIAVSYFNSINYHSYFFWGGYENSQRCFLAVGDDISKYSYPFTALAVSFREKDSLNHRDFLGALMSLGINREAVGDILTEPGRAVFFVKDELSDFILQQMTKVGRVGVTVSVCDTDDLPEVSEPEELILNVASLRLDNIISAFTGLSREKTNKLIFSEMVSVNHAVCKNNSLKLRENDIVSVRKKGKFIFTGIVNQTKKGRFRVAVKYFR